MTDTLAATLEALAGAADTADLIITSGGVSVGDEDHVKTAVRQLGALDLWRVAIKPGKPLAMGRVRQTPFLGLPGNPVSLSVTFCLFGRPMVLRLQGVRDVHIRKFAARTAFSLPADKRTRFQQARITANGQDLPDVELFPRQGSGVMSSTSWATGLVEMPAGRVIGRRETVRFLPYAELLA